LLNQTAAGDWQALKQGLVQVKEAGYSPKQLAFQLIDRLQNQDPTQSNLELIQQLLQVGASPEPSLKLEVVMLRQALGSADDSQVRQKRPKPQAEATTPAAPISDIQAQHWPDILADIKARNNSLYAVLRLAEPLLEDDVLKLKFGFEFHKQRLDDSHNRQLVAEAVSARLGRPITVVSAVGAAVEPPPATKSSQDLDQVLQVMGGGELSQYEEKP
jgi:hypothetical protein